MFTKKDSELELMVKKTHQKIKSALTLGSGNQPDNLERTAGWSGSAVEHSRMNVSYKKNVKGFKENLSLLKKKLHDSKKNPLLDYASYGGHGLIARAGNCQEYVGLAVYYLIQNNSNPNLKIQFLEMDNCFDHVLLKLSTEKEKLIYDPWMGLFYKDVADMKGTSKELKATADKIIEGLEYEMNSTDDKLGKNEIKEMIKECNARIKKTNLKLHTIGTLSTKDFQGYCKVFDDSYTKELQELYPKNPHLK
jgi:hypothetical protein